MTLLDQVLEVIDREGPIPFSRYMDLALYDPTLGFYATRGAGRRRDFLTSPEVGPLYGAVVARAIDAWWDALGRPDTFTFVDAGAGPGTLARAVLRSPLQCRDALEYITVESSAAQRADHPDEVTTLGSMPSVVADGVIFANELLDNLPFDIVASRDGRTWHEVRVGTDGRSLCEVMPQTESDPMGVGGGEGEVRMPVQAAAVAWLRSALASVTRGRVVVIDYAVPSYPTDPRRDWLRTYSDQGRGGDPLDTPGSKDITADVDISQLVAVAPTVMTSSQAGWLRAMGIDELVAEGAAHWDDHRAAPDLTAFEMRSRTTEAAALLDPSGLGAFSVLEWAVDGS